MDYDKLMELLDIDSPDDFRFFEQFASLVECDEEIPYDLFFTVLADVDSETLVDITDNYFEDILQGMPDDGIEVYTLLDTVRQALIGLAKNATTREERVSFVDELYKFRNWYIFDSIVHITRTKDNAKRDVTVSDALSLYRLEKLNEDQYLYDFSDSMDYEIDEYAISFDAELDLDTEYGEANEEDEDLYEEGLIDKEFPVIDGESYEEEDDY